MTTFSRHGQALRTLTGRAATLVAHAESWSRSLVPASPGGSQIRSAAVSATCPTCGARVRDAHARRPMDLLADVATLVVAIRPTNQVLVVARIAAAVVLVVLRVRGSGTT